MYKLKNCTQGYWRMLIVTPAIWQVLAVSRDRLPNLEFAPRKPREKAFIPFQVLPYYPEPKKSTMALQDVKNKGPVPKHRPALKIILHQGLMNHRTKSEMYLT